MERRSAVARVGGNSEGLPAAGGARGLTSCQPDRVFNAVTSDSALADSLPRVLRVSLSARNQLPMTEKYGMSPILANYSVAIIFPQLSIMAPEPPPSVGKSLNVGKLSFMSLTRSSYIKV